MYIKMMGAENLPDSDPRKRYTLIECKGFELERDFNGDAQLLKIFVYKDALRPNLDDLQIAVGNVYILNDEGKTIEAIPLNVPNKKRK